MGENHPGWYWESQESQTQNFKMIGGVARTRRDSTYRNSDLAFWGDKVYAGHYDGFQIIDGSDPEAPDADRRLRLPGLAARRLRLGRPAVRLGRGAAREPGLRLQGDGGRHAGFEGMRIFDVSDPAKPALIKGVPTDCGSHTHTLVPDAENGRVLLYVASYTAAPLPVSQYGNECRRLNPDGSRAHQKISVVEVPLANPAASDVVSEPTFPQNDRGGTPGFNGCHDITVYMAIERAGSACMGEGQIWDISDKAHPKTIARIHNPNVEFFHSAAFSWTARPSSSVTRPAAARARAAARRTPTRSARCGSTTSRASTTWTTRPWSRG